MIGKTLSHFKVTAKLGEGGMGEVYRAEDLRLGREVAIKVLPAVVSDDSDRLARFQREARTLASLNHQNIAAIHDVLEVDGQQLLILELVEGVTLAERIARGPVPLEEALGIARQIAEALETAHERGVIHRDLKPANVKIAPEGQVKVLDFGLAKAMEHEHDVDAGAVLAHSPTLTANMTMAGMLLGTAAYMSPEQARGLPADKRADVWAFGCVLYEMLTGRQTFQEDTVSDTLAAVLKTRVNFDELPAGTPERVRRLVRRCLEKDRRQRLRDIGEARIACERALAAPEDPAPPTPLPGTGTTARSSRSALPWTLVALLAITAAGLGVALWLGPADRGQVVRSSLALPPEVTLSLDSRHPGPPAVSADGRRIVFAALRGRDTPQLWIRDLDDLEPRPIAGTDGAGYPFWSPDGGFIGFFADGKLKKVAATGGAVLSLCDAPRGKGGAWSPAGDIVFAPDSGSPLHTVPAAGGASVALTEFGENFGEGSHRHPRMLPDGKHFVYLARSSVSATDELRIGSMDRGAGRTLTQSVSQGEYALGHLLYLQESVLMARPFDPDSNAFTGDAFPVAADVALVSAASVGIFAAAGDALAYLRGNLSLSDVQLNWRSRSGELLETIGEPERYHEVKLSPDNSMAVVSIEEESTQSLWVWDLERSVKSRVTSSEGVEFAVAWAPGSDRLVYASLRGDTQHLYVKSVGIGDEAILLEDPRLLYANDWSSDGRYVSISRYSTGFEQWFLDLETSKVITLDVPAASYGMVSPDGRRLAYVSLESGRSEVYLTSFPVAGRTWQVSPAGGGHPSWSADGKEIYYVTPDTAMLTAVPIAREGDRFTIGRPETLFQVVKPERGIKYAAAKDGQRFLALDPVAPQQTGELTLVLNWSAALGAP